MLAVVVVAPSAPAVAADGGKTSLQILSATVKDKVIDGAQVMFQKTGASTVSATTNDSGKVRVGNGMKRFATQDSGKVRVGNGMKRF